MLEDSRDGYVSIRKEAESYGVAVDPKKIQIDEGRTAELQGNDG